MTPTDEALFAMSRQERRRLRRGSHRIMSARQMRKAVRRGKVESRRWRGGID